MSTPPVPQHCPGPRELDDLELLVSGGLAPMRRFNEVDSPVTLQLPADIAAAALSAGAVELVDPEGVPLARMTWPAGDIEPLAVPEHGPFRRLRLTPEQVRGTRRIDTVVPVTDALRIGQIDALRRIGPVTLLAYVGTGTPALSPVALIRATLAAAVTHGDARVVAVPLASHGDPETDHALGVQVAHAFAGGAAVADPPEAGEADVYAEEIAAIITTDRPPPAHQGLVLFFTGLSGSGKSTLARALTDTILEHSNRTVTSLDGDVVRRNLSAGLTYSPTDRETNIRRIGWVAAEIARHHGIAVVSPIAPYHHTRHHVRTTVHHAGGAFFLIHVATPLAECERRDRKGLYAAARAGTIPDFTGISAPYEEPHDADLRIDTTHRTIHDTLTDILTALRTHGYLDLDAEPEPEPLPEPSAEPLRVLFVCTANICRSPIMEALARRMMGDGAVEFASAGTHGFPAHPIDDVVASALPDGAADPGFRSRRVTAAMLAEADVVLTAEAAHREFVLAEDPGLFKKVYSLGQFAAALEQAPVGVTSRELLGHVATRRGAADPALDVPDPYRRGPAAAADAVAQIGSLLAVVLPRLAASGGPGS